MTLFWRVVLAMVGVALLTAGLMVVLAGGGVYRAIEASERGRLVAGAARKAEQLRSYVRGARGDVLALGEVLPAADLLTPAAQRSATATLASRQQALHLLRAEMEAKPQYLQLRLIRKGEGGREALRLERVSYGAPVRVVPEQELQFKGHRTYLQRTLAQSVRQVYVSSLDLNQERGRIQIPHIPVLRIGTPLRGSAGSVIGALILNLDMGPALHAVQKDDGSGAEVYLLERDGAFLVHPDPERRYGSDLSHGIRVSREWPALHQQLLRRGPRGWSATLAGPLHDTAEALTTVQFATLEQGPQRVAVVLRARSALVRALRAAEVVAVSALSLAVLVAALVAILLARAVTGPLRKITRLVDRFPNERGAIEALPEQAAGEIGQLARAFARMRATVRARTEELERQQARLERVIRSAPVAMFVVGPRGQILLANGHALHLFDYAESDLVGRMLGDLMPASLREQQQAEVARFLQDNPRGGELPTDLTGQTRDGVLLDLHVGLSPLQSSEGDTVVVSVADVTERKRMEKDLRRSNEELEQFAYVASHDLQEPLRMVASYTELLGKRYAGQLDERADKYIGFAVAGAQRMQRLISDLLTYSRVGHSQAALVPIELQLVVEDVLDSLQTLLERTGAQVKYDALPAVLGDASLLRQLLQNLISNAVKFRGELPPRVRVEAERQDSLWRIAVHDNGIGLSKTDQAKVFQMFQRLHSAECFEGSGIGLAIAKRIVEGHGGSLWYEGEPGHGTTFFFTLRAAPNGD